VIPDFRREVDAICTLLRYYVTCGGNSLPTFRDNLSVPKRRWGITSTLCIISHMSADLTSIQRYRPATSSHIVQLLSCRGTSNIWRQSVARQDCVQMYVKWLDFVKVTEFLWSKILCDDIEHNAMKFGCSSAGLWDKMTDLFIYNLCTIYAMKFTTVM
jgi:hypothetical protein